MNDDEECIHLNHPSLCTICNGKDGAGKRRPRATPAAKATPATRPTAKRTTATPSRRLTTTAAPRSDETAESVEQYRSRFAEDRQETFDAYVEVFFSGGADDFPGGWLNFSRCASAEPERKATAPALVARAERLMRGAGYEADDSGRPQKARRWIPAS